MGPPPKPSTRLTIAVVAAVALPLGAALAARGAQGVGVNPTTARVARELQSAQSTLYYGFRTAVKDAGLEKPIHLDPPSSQPYSLARSGEGRSYSQYSQDLVLAPLFKGIERGFFVESGARDGEQDSNTLFYEMSGWQGLLVEPGAEYSKIAGKHRKAYVFNGALSPSTEPMTLEFLDAGNATGLGLGHFEDADHVVEQPGLLTRFDVQAEPLERLLRAVDPSRRTVDFWSLDIEGSEGMVLESTDFTRIEVGVLMVEMKTHRGLPEDAVNNERCAKALARAGFRDIGRTKFPKGYLDHVFVNEAYFRRRGLAVPQAPGLG